MVKKIFDVFGSRILNVLFWALLLAAVVAVVWRADFVFGDEELFLRTICRGLPIPLQVFPASGRCYPLSHWDCNFVLLLPRCLQAHLPQVIYAVKALVFALTLFLFARFQAAQRKPYRMEAILAFLTVVAFVFAPSVLLVSCWNIFPEQRMLLLLLVFLWTAFRGVSGGSTVWICLAGLMAVLLFGYKETSFVLIGGFAGTCLLGGWRRFAARERIFFLSLFVLAVAYCAMYCFVFTGRVSASYQADHKIGFGESLVFYAKQPELTLAALLAIVRAVSFVRGRSGRHLLWDAMLFAGVSFVFAYVVLQLTSIYNYYQSPAYVFLLPVFLHWLIEAARRFRLAGILGIFTLLFLIAYNARQTVPQVLGHLERRRVEMAAVRGIASDKKLKHVYYYYPGNGVHEDYHRYFFGLYLEYAGCGLPLESVRELRKSLDEGEVEIVPTYPYFLNEPSAVQTECFTIVKGPVRLDRPRSCGREGLLVRAGDYGLDGHYAVADKMAWAGRKVTLRLRLDPVVQGRPFDVFVRAGAAISPKHPKNAIFLRVDGEIVGREENVWPPHVIRFAIPASRTASTEIEISVEAEHAIRPAEDGVNADRRSLGVCFSEMKLEPIVD